MTPEQALREQQAAGYMFVVSVAIPHEYWIVGVFGGWSQALDCLRDEEENGDHVLDMRMEVWCHTKMLGYWENANRYKWDVTGKSLKETRLEWHPNED